MDFEFETMRTYVPTNMGTMMDAKTGADDDGPSTVYFRYDDVERLLAARAAAEKPTGDLTDEQIERVWIELPLTGAYNMGEARIKFARAIERAAIAARQSQQEPAGHVVDIDRNCNESIISVALEPGTEIYLAPASQEGAHAAREEVRDAVRDAVAGALSGTYYCNRVWSAWSVGTMSEDDFSPADEDDDILDGVVDAVFEALKTPASAERSGDHE